MLRRIFFVLSLCVSASCAATPSAPEGVGWTAERPDTQISSVAEGGELRITIASASGIGGATLTLPSAPAPRRVLLLLRLQGLEELRLSYGGTTVVGWIASSGEHDVRQAVVHPDGDPHDPRPIGPSSPFWMPMRLVARDPAATPAIPLGDGWVEVELPPDAYAGGQRTIALRWVDFFR